MENVPAISMVREISKYDFGVRESKGTWIATIFIFLLPELRFVYVIPAASELELPIKVAIDSTTLFFHP